MMRVGKTSLIIGGDSCIGTALAAYLRMKGEYVLTTSRRQRTSGIYLDLLDDVSDWQPPAPIDSAFFCAAQTSLAECRNDPVRSLLINVENTQIIAQKLAAIGSFLVWAAYLFLQNIDI